MERYGGGEKSRRYYTALLERLRALPGVRAAGAATALPASPLGPDFERPVWPDGTPEHERGLRSAWLHMVTVDYVRTLGMRVAAGRAFDERDGPGSPRTVMLSAGLARKRYRAVDALATALSRVVAGVLYGTSPLDPAALLAVAALPLTALVVSLHPAWRATRIPAAEVLRCD